MIVDEYTLAYDISDFAKKEIELFSLALNKRKSQTFDEILKNGKEEGFINREEFEELIALYFVQNIEDDYLVYEKYKMIGGSFVSQSLTEQESS